MALRYAHFATQVFIPRGIPVLDIQMASRRKITKVKSAFLLPGRIRCSRHLINVSGNIRNDTLNTEHRQYSDS